MHGFKLWLIVTELVLVLLMVPGILGWGLEGHYATCKIAEGRLSGEALAAVKQLLPASAGGDLAEVCSWPDDIRRQYRWSSALHFADTPDLECNYDYTRDCHDSSGEKDRCVTAAIFNYTAQLSAGYQNSFESEYNLTEALMFLSHFIGDVHQPLHIGFIGDLGGNTIKLQWYENTTNLHRVWDDMIIGSALTTFYNSDLALMIQTIEQTITNNWSSGEMSWGICANTRKACPNPYASESITLACEFAYPNATEGTTLGDEYFFSRLPVVEKRLAQGGVRLAATLNRIFSSQPSIAQA